MANAYNEMVKQTLERFGYSKEDIQAAFEKIETNVSLTEARIMLEERKKIDVGKNPYDLANYQNMIIISSDSEDDEMNKENFKAPKKNKDLNQNERPTLNLSISSSNLKSPNEIESDDNENSNPFYINDNQAMSTTKANTSQHFPTKMQYAYDPKETQDAFRCANGDLPDEKFLNHWFTSNYRMEEDQVVIKDDMFNAFCLHFNVPSYPELRKLFFEKINIILRSTAYRGVECIEVGFFDGLSKIEPHVSSKISDKLQKMLNLNSKVDSVQAKHVKEKLGDNMVHPVPKPRSSKRNIHLCNEQVVNNEKKHKMAANFFNQPSDSNENDKVYNSSMNSQIQDLFGSASNVKLSSKNNNHLHDDSVITLSAKKTAGTEEKKHESDVLYHDAGKQNFTDGVSDKRKVSHTVEKYKSSRPNKFNQTYSKLISKDKLHKLPTKNITNKDVSSLKRDKTMHLTNLQLLKVSPIPVVSNLRPIIIDGSNVACTHGADYKFKTYSCRGIALCVRYFLLRGHKDITCFVPNFRKGRTGQPPTTGQEVLYELEKRSICKFTPSRKVDGKNIVSYDDRFIVMLAEENGGVIVSNDQYRDLMSENPRWKQIIVNRLLQYLFVQDFFMPATDPLGQDGPNLDQFLQFSDQPRKIDSPKFGIHSSDMLKKSEQYGEHSGDLPLAKFPEKDLKSYRNSSRSPSRIKSNYDQPKKTDKSILVKNQLKELFPEKDQEIDALIRQHPYCTDLNGLANSLFTYDTEFI